MLMTSRIHCLGLFFFFSVLIFAVHGVPTRKGFSVTILHPDPDPNDPTRSFEPVLDGCLAGTKGYITRMINEWLTRPGAQRQHFKIEYNTKPSQSGLDQGMVRFVLQGSILCPPLYPCFGWIVIDPVGIYGQIFWVSNLIPDSQGHQVLPPNANSHGLQPAEWNNKIWNRDGISTIPANDLITRCNGRFKANQRDWLDKWNTVTQPRVTGWYRSGLLGRGGGNHEPGGPSVPNHPQQNPNLPNHLQQHPNPPNHPQQNGNAPNQNRQNPGDIFMGYTGPPSPGHG
ncbi:hypothetical protein BDP27DRAFT_941782 [Rhodocollybia butyracea]|uniref:Uncharacterized protein n=1 Tax=Rhodocollybia butyracea TaxID=206335 RepID=A0A9P5PPK2_9AGAR|nr:hypothetical protein BDP27DRAFT_941782 [Rhodocollybia butyracea]